MQLPGGVWVGEGLRRDFAFRPLTGALEMQLADVVDAPVPVRVSTALATVLAHVGGAPVDTERVHAMSIGDRQFLARQFAACLAEDKLWLTAACSTCDGSFDFQVQQSTLPVKPAAASYPCVTVDTRLGALRLRTPNGADQIAVHDIGDEQSAIRVLIQRLLLTPSVCVDQLQEDDVRRIEAAIEECAPEVATVVAAQCPHCAGNNRVEIDPYLSLSFNGEALLSEIHRIASHYHWSEAEILQLPRARRQQYLRLLDSMRGMQQ